MQNLFQFEVSATSSTTPVYDPRGFLSGFWHSEPVPSTDLRVLNKAVGADAQLYLALPDNQTFNVTPDAPPPRYSYSVTPYKMEAILSANTYDLSETSPTFCVGQQITFSLYVPALYVNAAVNWNLPKTFRQ